MASEDSSDPRFEIGHVLFMDIVGYSKLLIHEQSERQRQLNEVVRDSEQFRAAKKSGKTAVMIVVWKAELAQSYIAQARSSGRSRPRRESSFTMGFGS